MMDERLFWEKDICIEISRELICDFIIMSRKNKSILSPDHPIGKTYIEAIKVSSDARFIKNRDELEKTMKFIRKARNILLKWEVLGSVGKTEE